ncbi:MAG: hypothetical protein K6F09_00270 [Clostridiales bacterium]|nr:hypothetical protein [Clostridiales bacterium]
MKRINRLTALLTALILIISSSVIYTSAETGGLLSAENVSGKAGETVAVPIILSDNPGIIAIRLSVKYDNTKLKLLSAEDGGLLGQGHALFCNDITIDPYVLLWEDSLSTTDYTESGTLATLTFEILKDAPAGNTEIEVILDSDSTFDHDLELVTINTADGYVTIKNEVVPPVTGDDPLISIGSREGTFKKKVQWWKPYSSADMQLYYRSINCDDAVRISWSSSNRRVEVDQGGRVTNNGLFSRKAKITVEAIDKDDNVIASSSVYVAFYKFAFQKKRLKVDSVSDGAVFENAAEEETPGVGTLYLIERILFG